MGLGKSYQMVTQDFKNEIDKLDSVEKMFFLFGIFALYGDGEVSAEEIECLKTWVSELDEFDGVVHKAIDNKYLKDLEKTAYLIERIKEVGEVLGSESKRDVKDLFVFMTESLDKSILKKFADNEEKQKWFGEKILKALNEIANADGNFSEGEKELVKLYRKKTKLLKTNNGCIGCIGVIAIVAAVWWALS